MHLEGGEDSREVACGDAVLVDKRPRWRNWIELSQSSGTVSIWKLLIFEVGPSREFDYGILCPSAYWTYYFTRTAGHSISSWESFGSDYWTVTGDVWEVIAACVILSVAFLIHRLLWILV